LLIFEVYVLSIYTNPLTSVNKEYALFCALYDTIFDPIGKIIY